MPEFYEYIAPHIVGNEDIKKMLSLILFSRPELGERLNVLLIGNAASGKSEMLVDLTRISNAKYATSKMSKAGLTGAMFGANFVPGILTECDKGIICIDELDKIKAEERTALLEALQKGTSTIIKAMHHKTENARVNAIAAANPISGKWTSVPKISEIPFDMPMLSRFHIVAPYKDMPGSMYDRIAEGIEYKITNFETEQDMERREKIKQYVAMAKEKIERVDVPPEIVKELGFWVGMLKDDSNFALPITPRMIEGMLSMLRAKARMHMRNKVIKEDLDFAKKTVLNIQGKWNF